MGQYSQLVRSLFWLAVLCHEVFWFVVFCFSSNVFLQHLLCSHLYKQGHICLFSDSISINGSHTEQKRIYYLRDLCSLQEKVASHGVYNSYSCFQEGMKWRLDNRNISLTLIVCLTLKFILAKPTHTHTNTPKKTPTNKKQNHKTYPNQNNNNNNPQANQYGKLSWYFLNFQFKKGFFFLFF